MTIVSARPSDLELRHYINWLIRRDAETRAAISDTVARVAAGELGGPDQVRRLTFPCGHEAYIDAAHDLYAHPHWCPACQPALDAPGCTARIFYATFGAQSGL